MAAWAGLGYYSRARNLIACARDVAAACPSARFPETAAELAGLPGIGAYTSAAIAAIAFDEPVAVVDANVERVIPRLFAIDTPLPAAKPLIREALQPLVPRRASRRIRRGADGSRRDDLHAARGPPAASAPGPSHASRGAKAAARMPVKAAKKPRPTRYGTAYVVRRADGAILLRRRPPRGLLGGMSEVPGTEWGEAARRRHSPPVAAKWTRASPRSSSMSSRTLNCGFRSSARRSVRCRRARRPLVGAGNDARRRGVAERHEKGHRGGLSGRHETHRARVP